MFSNLSWYEVVALLLLALFVFGDRLPQLISDGIRMLRNLRRMAQTATSDLSRELGTDIQLEDLNPRAFVRKHILSEADQEALLKPLKGVSEDVQAQARGLEDEFKEVGRRAEGVAGEVRDAAGAAGTRGTARRGGSRAAGRTSRAVSASPDSAPATEPAATEPAAEPAASAKAPYEDVT